MAKNSFTDYFVNSFQELRKVTWPTKNQAIRLTAIVLGFCLFMALLLGLFDGLFSYGYKYLLTLT
jgi:preprotein translocase subunit SecE